MSSYFVLGDHCRPPEAAHFARELTFPARRRIIGGSVTAGHGLNGKPSWHQRFFTEFQQAFPNSEIFDGSVPAMGSGEFGS